MDYGDRENYNETVMEAQELLDQINGWVITLPPYKDFLRIETIPTLAKILNEHHYALFEDGLDYDDLDNIGWHTINEYGFGEEDEHGNGHFILTKFVLREDDQYDQQDIEFQIHVKEAQDEHNRAITKFFDDYIAFIEAYRTVHKTYGVFLNQYIHKNSNFPTDIEVAKLFEVFNQTEPYGFKKNSCSMTSFGYKTLRNENHEPILCEEITFADLSSFLYYDLFNGIRKNHIPNRCRNCGRWFLIRAGKYFSYCDRPLSGEPDKTCRDVGSRRRYEDKCKNDPVWLTYNRAYKAHYARYMKKKMTVSEFEEWSRFASELRDMALAEKIKFENYCEQIKK